MTTHDILTECAAEFRVTPAELTRKTRRRDACDARHVAIWILDGVGLTTSAVARVMGHERTLVTHAKRKVAALLQSDIGFRRSVERIKARLAATLVVGDLAAPTTG